MLADKVVLCKVRPDICGVFLVHIAYTSSIELTHICYHRQTEWNPLIIKSRLFQVSTLFLVLPIIANKMQNNLPQNVTGAMLP